MRESDIIFTVIGGGTGIPLPFISQEGLNLISNIVEIGLILSIQYNQETLRHAINTGVCLRNEWKK